MISKFSKAGSAQSALPPTTGLRGSSCYRERCFPPLGAGPERSPPPRGLRVSNKTSRFPHLERPGNKEGFQAAVTGQRDVSRIATLIVCIARSHGRRLQRLAGVLGSLIPHQLSRGSTSDTCTPPGSFHCALSRLNMDQPHDAHVPEQRCPCCCSLV